MAPVPVDLSKIDYRALLRRNVPGSGPFMGMRYQRGGNQRGAGLGGILSAAMSLLPRIINSTAGQHLVSAGKQLGTELSQGKDFKSSLKHVASNKLRELSGGGRKRIKGGSVRVLKPHLVSGTKERVNFLSS